MLYPVFKDQTRANPQPLYAQMREENPICRLIGPTTGNIYWFFTRYDDCVAILKDPRVGKDSMKLPPDMRERFTDTGAFQMINRHLLTLDPPDHTRLRTLVHRAFTPQIIQNLQPRIASIAHNLIDRLPDSGTIDFISQFAFPIPVTVIAELLGVPATDQDDFRRWTRAILFWDDVTDPMTAIMEFVSYCHALFDERLINPQNDLITGLVQVEEAGDKLDRQELLSMVFLLLVAGHETTVNLLANGLLALLQHPDQLARLRTNPPLMPTAVEEMLRFNGPIEAPTTRWVYEPMDYRGYTIEPGDILFPILLAANRDPAQFPEADTFDITREPNRHIAFGHGIHYCLGAPLARLEGVVAMQVLLEQLPHIELAVAEGQLQWNTSLLIHGMKDLPVFVQK